jgi:nucleoside-diphosphate-sugar epimerase
MVNDLHGLRIGLIGANGFMGSAILDALIRAGATPSALCGPYASPRRIPDSIQCTVCDLCDTDCLMTWTSGLDTVIHAAGLPSVRRSFEMSDEYVRVHVQGTTVVLRSCDRNKVKRFVYISSAEVYGRPEVNPVPEEHRLQARSPYGAVKIGAEKMIEAFVETFGLHAIVLRPFSIYGHKPPAESLLANILAMAQTGAVQLRDTRPIRDYCYVGDFADAVLQSVRFQRAGLHTFNIGTGKGTSVADFATSVLRAAGKEQIAIEDREECRPGQSEIFELVADISKAREVLGWKPVTNLADGLRQALASKPPIA